LTKELILNRIKIIIYLIKNFGGYMKQTQELLDTGLYETFTPDRAMTVADLLSELNLEGKYFGILVDGKKADPATKIDVKSEVVILPHSIILN